MTINRPLKTLRKIKLNSVNYKYRYCIEGELSLDPNDIDCCDYDNDCFIHCDAFISKKDKREIINAFQNIDKLNFEWTNRDVEMIRPILQPVLDTINKRNGF